ncbi:hypothetical protein FDP41_012433 [Naegleria fowleri]|uniref:Thymidine kinase n=1 Tax=Naegleria fowleri TaxID=5763 RepID=A0A6A5C274_NAEFO|nr:uncharacterized protein FDP41_012433 [Naegleria fowleri]KAF0981776.1 hypothetical protein FDP41_012433 [Naegleria fowleri]
MPLILITGCMFSGKTTELFAYVEQVEKEGQSWVIFKKNIDTRYSKDHACSHNQVQKKATSTENLMNVLSETKQHDMIAVDEGQFFSDLVPFCEELVKEGKTVVVSALNADYKNQPFPVVSALSSLEYTEIIEKKAECQYCKQENATCSILKDQPDMSATSESFIIGGAESYCAACIECRNKLVNK